MILDLEPRFNFLDLEFNNTFKFEVEFVFESWKIWFWKLDLILNFNFELGLRLSLILDLKLFKIGFKFWV